MREGEWALVTGKALDLKHTGQRPVLPSRELDPGFAFAGGAGGQHGVRAVALALEGIAGEGKAVAGIVVVKGGPIDGKAMGPGFAEG